MKSFPRHAGAALVIILAFLVLLTGLALAFFSRATTERQVSSSSAAQTKADLLARSASDLIVADLKQEIAAGSTAYTPVAGTTIYTPTADARPNPPAPTPTPPVITPSVVPWVSGAPTPAANGLPPVPNLIRRSVRANDPTYAAYPATYYNPPQNLASAVNSTTDLSANGRSVALTQWNSHYLIPTANASNNAPVGSFVAPDWVMVTKSGPKVLTAPDATTIGRYAYAIYDEGGLLDANVAGCPSGVTSAGTLSNGKGFAAFADLTALGLQQSDVDKLVGWRNHATTQSTGTLAGGYTFGGTATTDYFSYVLGQTGGFLSTNTNKYTAGTGSTAGTFTSTPMAFSSGAQTDQVFADRQSLIRFWTAAGFDRSSLQYFGTFTRDMNLPNFVPLANPCPNYPMLTSAGLSAIITYPVPTQATPNPPQVGGPVAGNEPNPIPQNVLITAGTNAGQPLITRRFPLSALALLADPTNNATAIKHYFGLTYYSTPLGTTTTGFYQWKYSHTVPVSTGSATSILSLSQVAALTAPRETGTDPITGMAYRQEPDFFEYLQAAVLYGSLGNYNPGAPPLVQTSTTPANGCSTASNIGFNASSKPSQFCENIILMGLNLIDQYDADNTPFVVNFNSQTFAGLENLPYLSEFLIWPYRPKTTSPMAYMGHASTVTNVGDSSQLNLAIFGLIELWNPHQNAVNASTGSFPQLRFRIQSGSVNSSDGTHVYAASTETNEMPSELLPGGTIFNVTFNNTSKFQEPALLGTDNGAASTDGVWYQMTDETNSPRSGLLLAVSQLTDKDLSHLGSSQYQHVKIRASPSSYNPLLFLQFSPDGVTWYNYQGENFTLNSAAPAGAYQLPTNQSEIIANVNDPSPFGTPQVKNDVSFSVYRNVGGTSAQVPDPRTKSNSSLVSAQSTLNLTMRPGKPDGALLPTTGGGSYSGASVGRYCLQYPPSYAFPTSTDTHTFSPNPAYLAMYNENDSSSGNAYLAIPINSTGYNTYAVDPDGVARPGDGYYGGDPMHMGNMSARPLLLNRPFRSVGEMGYAQRGCGVWKSINFFSEQSADAGLLDYFSIDSAPLSAGKINLNTRQPKVLQAMLQGAYRIEPTGSTPVDTLAAGDSGDAGNLAKAIVKHTTATTMPTTQPTPPYIPGPLVSRADLVRSLLGDPAVTSALNGVVGTTSPPVDAANTTKTRREALVRALADVGTTRTWNLLIDIVAQSGVYPPNATDLKRGFVVQGEKHYWLHVALDRYTGSVIDQQLELVND